MARRACAVAALLLLAGCGKADSDTGPGGVTVGEARQLDRDAAKLDRQAPSKPAATH